MDFELPNHTISRKALMRKSNFELIQMIQEKHVHNIVKLSGDSYFTKSVLADIINHELNIIEQMRGLQSI